MTQEDFKARVSMAYEGREQWDAFLDRVWLIHTSELPRWISVEDELPKTEEPYFDYNDEVCDDLKCSNKVLVIANNDFHIATLNQNYNDGEPTGTPYWFDEERSECGDWLNGKVTHWMPLPQAPKKGGEQ